MPVALVTQTMPLVALTPLLVLILGRGPSLILWITVSVTFFPAFVTMAQGLSMVSRAAIEVPKGLWRRPPQSSFGFVSIPASLPYLFAATRLAVPRAPSRCDDCRMAGHRQGPWQLAQPVPRISRLRHDLVSFRSYLCFISVLFYQIVVAIEHRVLSKRGMAPAQ